MAGSPPAAPQRPAPQRPARPLRNYDLVAGVYDLGCHVYSGGAIAASKRAHLRFVSAGDRVLYLGVGTGAEAVEACANGAAVTAVDLSPKMLARLRRRLDARGLDAELILGDALAHRRSGQYDAVVAHYFFNLFEPEAMRAALRQAAALLRPGGRLIVADLAPPRGGRLRRLLNHAYSKAATAAFLALRLAPWRPNYHYAAECRAVGLQAEGTIPFRWAGAGPIFFETVVARRPDRPPTRPPPTPGPADPN
ncbi:class I SAM-dependent methyltransferase [Alienimonas californiensis]|uniref:Ubiquinone/menaquinone biosynthesis methyltransferase n=1 Tax=Alienimonas californiensis TaxID=2527989 RepID=A0A517P5D3_9PLAN|nr:methyltransferase domain-containing protein [Alienimonas californiensis]QDT14577.1 ubiquinone/menaquinone biosynthesis methyltransferase [Alienimonas californiensis]